MNGCYSSVYVERFFMVNKSRIYIPFLAMCVWWWKIVSKDMAKSLHCGQSRGQKKRDLIAAKQPIPGRLGQNNDGRQSHAFNQPKRYHSFQWKIKVHITSRKKGENGTEKEG